MKRAFLVVSTCLLGTLLFAAVTSADAPATQPDDGVIRIKAGADKPFTDPQGHVWKADTGFDGGDTVSRDPGLKIDGTDMPDFYRSEHYDMTGWSGDVPNGTYTVKLYFCETYEGITGAGQRVFDVSVGDQKLKDFDVFKVAGGPQKPVVKTIENVPVTNGKLTITFGSNVQSPQINGIEIIPKK
jgi:hypothetical protein